MSQESFINYKSVEETECTVNQELKLIKQNAQSVIEQLNMYFESSQQNLREMEEVYFASIQELESGFIYLMNQFRQSYNEQKECYQKEYEEKKFNLANEMNKTQRYIQDLALLEAIDGSMSFMQVQKCLKNLNKISDEIKVFYNQTHVQSFQLETINVDALLMKILQNLLFDSIYQRPKTKLFAQKISKQRSFSSSSQALQTSSMYYTGSSCENKEDEIVEKINTDSYHSRIKSSSSGQLEAKKEFKQEMHQTSPYSEKQPKIESFQVEQVQVEKEKNQKQLQENSSQQKQEKTMKQQYESIPYLKKYKTPNELSSIKKLSANYEKEKDEQKSYLKGLKQKIPKQSVKKNVFQHQTLSTQQNQKNTEQINRTPEKKRKSICLSKSPQFQDQSLLRNEEVLSLKLNSSDDLNVETTENTSQTKVQTLKTSEHDQIAEQNNVLNRSIGLGQCNSSDALKLNSMSSKRIKMGITNPEMLQLSKDYSADNINQSSKENYTNRKRITSCGGFIEKQSTFNNLNKTQIVNHISSSLNNSPATNPLNKLSNRNLFNRDRSLSGFRQNTNKEKFLDKSLQNDEIIQEFQLDQSKSSNQQQQQKCLFYSSPISACLSSAVQQNYALDNNLNQDNYDQCEFQESPQIFLNYNISGLSQINNIQTVESISIEGRNIQQSQCEASLFRNKIQNSVKKAVIPRQQIAIDQEQINHSSPSDLNLITTECFQQKNIHEIQNLFTNPSPISHSASNEMQLFTSQNFENGSIITSQYYLNQQQSACLLNSKQKIEKIESGSKLNKSQSNQNQNSYRAIYLSQKNGQLDKNCQQNQIQQNNLTKTAPQLSNCNTNFVQSNQHQQANQIQNSFVNQQNQHKNILINKSINNQNQRYNEITDFTQNTINNQNEISAQKQNQQEIFIQNEFDTQIDNQNNFYEIQIQRKNQNQNEDNQNKNSFYNRKEDSMTEFIKNENIVNSQDNNENIANQKINQNNQPTAATQQKQENQIINQIKQDSQNLHKGLFYHSYTNHGLISTRTINEEQDDEEEQSTQNINNRINTEQVQQTKYVNKMNLTQQLSNKERNNLGSLIQEANQQQNNNKQINQNNNNSQSISINNNFQKDLQANQNNSLQKCTISQQNILFQGKNDQNQFLDQQTIQNQVFSCHQLENANSAQCSKTNLLSQRDNKESVTVQASNKFQSKNINPLPPTANSKVQANNSKQNKIENINQNQFENQKQSQTEHLRQDSQKNPIGQNKNNENMCDQDYSYAQSNNKKDINEYLQSQDSVRQKSNQFAQAPSSRARSFSECSERIDYKLNYQPAYQNDSQTKLSLSRSNSNYQICTFERKIDKPLSSRQSSQTGEYNHNNCQQYFQGIEDSGSSCSNNYSANFGIINFRELVEQRIKNKDAQNSFKIKVKSSQYSNVNNLNQLKAVESSCSNVIIQQNNIFNQEVTDQSEMQQKNISNYQKVSSQIQIICTDNSQHTTPQQSIINQVQDSVQKQQQKLIEKNQPVPTHKYLLANYKKNDMGTTNQLSQALQQQTSIQQFQGEQVRHKVNSLNVKNTLNSPSPTLNPQPTQLRVNSIQNLMPQPQQNLQCQNNMSYKQENKAVCCLNYNMVQLGGNDCDSLGEIISNQGEIIKKINYNLPRNLLDFKDPGYYGFSCVMLPQSNCILFIGGYFAERNDEKQYNKKQLFSYEQKQQSSSEYKRIFTKDIIKYNINEDSFSSFTFKLSNFSYDLTAIYIEKSNEIFLIGGRDENDQILQDCMIINIKENRIIQKQPLPYSLTGFCCTYETSKENVYVLGGIISNKITNSAYKLSLSYTDSEQHSHLNEWSQMHNMINCRVGAQCKIIKKNLYVFGGYDGRLYLNSVEMYNFDLNKWFIITFMKIPRAFYSLVSDQDKILIIGGKASTQITANNIDIFDVSKDEWQSINCYNINRNNHYTFLLKQIPNQGNQTAHNQNHS